VDFSPSTNPRVRTHQITRAHLRLREEDITDFERVLGGIRMALGPAKRTGWLIAPFRIKGMAKQGATAHWRTNVRRLFGRVCRESEDAIVDLNLIRMDLRYR
jgi:hypothetical protein